MHQHTPKLRFFAALLSAILFASGHLLSQTKPTAPKRSTLPIFADIAEKSGLNFTHYNGMTGKLYLPEIMGSGSALLDYDNDGDLDIFIVQGKVLELNVPADKTIFPWKGKEPPMGKLFRNDLTVGKDGGRTIEFTDVTKKSGIVAEGYGFGAATGDINNDGFVDLYITNLGSNKLFLNNGNGTFSDVTLNSNVDDPRWSVGASFFDYDRDGFLDLMVVNYADFDINNHPKCYAPTSAADYCGPKAFSAVGNSIFHNKGDGTFENITTSSGINEVFGHGLGIVTADFNNDNWIDIYVANDGDPNQLWINKKNGKFEDGGFLSGAAVNQQGKSEASMGVDAGDFNQDGSEDIFITHLTEETHTLYENLGEAIFEDITSTTGLVAPDKRFTGFGTSFFDYDNDGLLDIFIANGAVKRTGVAKRAADAPAIDERYPLEQKNQLFRNTGNEKYKDVSGIAGSVFRLYEVSRGAAFGDIDNDGDTDILVVNNNGRARLLLNQIGNKNHWLGLKLIGENGKRDALGSIVEVFISEKNVLRRRARTDGSYASAHDPRVLTGLGSNVKIEKIRVTWASGKIEEWKNLSLDRYTTIKEGATAITQNKLTY